LRAAEDLGRLPELGRRVRTLAANAFADGPTDTLLFVNLHATDLLDPELYEDSPLRNIASRVVLELSERATIADVRNVRARVNTLRDHGFRIAIDDLGAGDPRLSNFPALEPDMVKLDVSLVRGMDRSAIRRRAIESMAKVCHEMDMLVVAEGVETATERESLRNFGCDLLQGYLFAKPGRPLPDATIE
jgi:EAL domain-containing protein (putative c-di-GMP-specific phosphodiesterase class I)